MIRKLIGSVVQTFGNMESVFEAESANLTRDSIKCSRYCMYFKYFLVEEIALIKNLHELHYGNCSVIGKIIQGDRNEEYFLENICLPNLPKEYLLPEGSVRLRLIRNNYRESLPLGKFCEVCGETVLEALTAAESLVYLTSKTIVEKILKSIDEDKADIQTTVNYINTSYQPAIKIEHVNTVDRAVDLAERNLEIRMLCQRTQK